MSTVATLHVVFAACVDWDDSCSFLTTDATACYVGWDEQAAIRAGDMSVDAICDGSWDDEMFDDDSHAGSDMELAARARLVVRHVSVEATDIADLTAPVWVVLHPSSERNKRGTIASDNDQHMVVACAAGDRTAATAGFHDAFEQFAQQRSAFSTNDRADLLSLFVVMCADPLTGSFVGAGRDDR